MEGWFDAGEDSVVIRLWVVPRASRTEVVGIHGEALKLRVAAPPEAGKANRAVLRFLSDTLGVASIELVSGFGSREKSVRVVGIDAGQVRNRLLA